MEQETDRVKINHSDELIETIRRASEN
ncbi:MAG: hypothetical protein K0R31_2421, partial [Clostridiales bacterium]|nr:hypothetical protein [Clostridiales bacterium]